jgi:DNA topoisomerase-1
MARVVMKDLHVAPGVHSARAAGLKYVRGTPAGIQRCGGPIKFRYLQDGRPVRQKEVLERIRKLAIPPAWQRVWINADPRGHLQATGFDVKGRKQYRYHPDWSALRNETKYTHALAFGKQLASMRDRVEEHLQLPGLPAEKVLATVVSVMDHTQIRVGHDEYARTNGTYGLSTLLDRHVKQEGTGLRFTFKGKTGIQHNIRLGSSRLAKLVMRCKELPGQDLFQYVDETGRPRPIDSGMVNDYIRSISNGLFTSKDMRTWKGTVHCVRALLEQGPASTITEQRMRINAALDQVAQQLGNTRAVCRKYYVHPAVVVAYERRTLMTVAAAVKGSRTLAHEERVVIRLLDQGRKRGGRTGFPLAA